MENRTDVDTHHRVVVWQRCVFDGSGCDNARSVHEHGNAAEVSHHGFHDFRRFVFQSQIGSLTPYALAGQVVQRGGISSDACHSRAHSGEAQSCGVSDAAGGTGHDNDLAFEIQCAIP